MKNKLVIVVLCLLIGFLMLSRKSLPPYEDWTLQSPMPTSRSEISSTVIDGRIFVAGGIGLFGTSNRFEMYDTETDSWESLAPLPQKLNHVGLASDSESIYLSGGFTNAVQTNYADVLYRYDIAADTWSELTTLPENRAAHSMLFLDNQLHLIGGMGGVVDVLTYDLTEQTWLEESPFPSLPSARDHHRVHYDGGRMFIVGGRRQGVNLKEILALEGGEWTVLAQSDEMLGADTSILFENRIHIVGGEDIHAGSVSSKHLVYDIDRDEWVSAPDLPTGRHGLVSEMIGGKWFVIGGGTRAGYQTIIATSNLVEVFDLSVGE